MAARAEVEGADQSNYNNIMARRPWVVVDPNTEHLRPVWIAMITLASILAFGSLVGAVLCCCSYQKRSQESREIDEDRRKFAERIARELRMPATGSEGSEVVNASDADGLHVSNVDSPPLVIGY